MSKLNEYLEMATKKTITITKEDKEKLYKYGYEIGKDFFDEVVEWIKEDTNKNNIFNKELNLNCANYLSIVSCTDDIFKQFKDIDVRDKAYDIAGKGIADALRKNNS